MKTLAMVTQKGGTGKTTLAASLAVAAQESGERVYCIDLDPQGSLYGWGQQREADGPSVDKTSPEQLSAALATLAKAHYTLAIIDTAGVDSAATAAAMRAADLALIPTRPSLLDIRASRPTMETLARLGQPFAFVLNQCPAGRNSRPQDAAKALTLLGMLAQPHLALRADHLDAVAQGLGVTEFAPSGKAADEVRQLWAWAKKTMEGKTRGQAAQA